jgi:hypothetical protein
MLKWLELKAECPNPIRVCQNHIRVCQNHNACRYYTLRVDITLVRVVIKLISVNQTLRVEITLVRFEITVVSVVITFVRVKITSRVGIPLCVYKSQSCVLLSHS